MSESGGDWLAAVRQVVAAARASDVSELEVEHGTFRVRLRREVGSAGPATPATPGREAAGAGARDAHLHPVVAPFTGVFYRAPTPASKVYASVGDWVDVDAVLGLVETMKVFNEVVADRAGRVAAIQAQSGQLVHAGEVLVLIEPGERTAAAPEPLG